MNNPGPGNASLLRGMARNYANGHAWDALDTKACEEAAKHMETQATLIDGLSRQLALYRCMLQATIPYVGDIAHDDELYARLREEIGDGPEVGAWRTPLLSMDWQDSILATIKRLGLCTPEVLAQAIADDLRRGSNRLTLESKPFWAAGCWFPVDVLGNPMREIGDGAWESWTREHPVKVAPPVSG